MKQKARRKSLIPPPLNPRVRMGRNEKCWCGSGKKWKHCHMDRHLQKEIPIGRLFKEMYSQLHRGFCLHPEASKETCSAQLAKAHTIQKSGALKYIQHNGHVVSGNQGFQDILKNKGVIIPKEIGIGNASTFMGFCSKHDNDLFEPIENLNTIINAETAFLLSFRAVAYEYLCKLNALRAIPLQRSLDKGKEFHVQAAIQEHFHLYEAGLKYGLTDIANLKKIYDECLSKKDYNAFPFLGIEFDGVMPFACCGGFQPEVDFFGRKIQNLAKATDGLDSICVNVAVIGARSFLVFSWKGQEHGPAYKFVKSFLAIDDKRKANAGLILGVEQFENVFFNPLWWDSLEDTKKADLVNRMKSGTGGQGIRRRKTYRDIEQILPDYNIIGQIANIDF